jgi:hypothetical protein
MPPGAHPPWRPGESGNPKGRPRKKTFTELAREVLNEVAPNGPENQTYLERILRKLIAQALGGNIRASELILSRADPVRTKIDKTDLRVLAVNIIRQGPEALDAQDILALPKPEKA